MPGCLGSFISEDSEASRRDVTPKFGCAGYAGDGDASVPQGCLGCIAGSARISDDGKVEDGFELT